MNRFTAKLDDIQRSLKGKMIQHNLLKKSQYWDAGQMHEYQLGKLKTLLTEASLHVPYYRELFRELGFDPRSDLRSVDDLKRLPLLTKQKAREIGAGLHTERRDVRFAVEKTSGSTGEPFVERISDEQMAFEKAAVWRHWNWANWRFRDRVAIVRTYVPKDGQPLTRHDALRNFRFYSAYHMDETNTRGYVRDMLRWRPKFLRGYPSSLEILANVSEAMGAEWRGVSGIFTASETLTDAQREKLERVFNSRVFDWYGLAEMVVSANECERHNGLHLNSEYGIWELEPRPYLNDDERMIVGANLHNIAMPLIRYETGDIAVLQKNANQTCGCGRTLPIIRCIRGRLDDILTSVDGRPAPSVNFYSLFREYESVKRFQLIQFERDLVELRLVSDSIGTKDLEEITGELRRRLGAGMRVRIKRTEEFLKNPAGKRRPVMSLIGAPIGKSIARSKGDE